MSNRKRRRIQEPEPATISRPPKVSVDNQPAPKDGSPRVVDEVLPPNQIAYIAGQTTESVVDALIDDPDSWSKADNGLYIHGDMTGTYVSIGDPGGKADFNAKDAYAKILEMGDEVAQTMLFIMARCLSNNEPTEKIRIHVNDSLGFRGISRHRKRDFRPDQKRAEARRFRLLSDIWVTAVDTIEVRVGRGKKAKKINVTSRLIEFELLTGCGKTRGVRIGPECFVETRSDDGATP